MTSIAVVSALVVAHVALLLGFYWLVSTVGVLPVVFAVCSVIVGEWLLMGYRR